MDLLKKKHELQGLKKLKINGMDFVIRKINPLVDFPSDKIPQIFTDYPNETSAVNLNDINYQKRMITTMHAYIEAAVVEPKLVPVGKGDLKGKEAGITVEDLFRDPGIGIKLYHEIYNHSMNRFRGIKRLFFSIGTKLSMLIMYASGMVSGLRIWSLKKDQSA